MFEGRGHDVLRQTVQPVRQIATPGWPPRREPLVAPPAQQRASAPRASSSASLLTPGRSLMRPTQPPRLKPSSPAGSWMTPSRETLSLTTIFPISVRLSLSCHLPRPPAGWVVRIDMGSHIAPVLMTISLRQPELLAIDRDRRTGDGESLA